MGSMSCVCSQVVLFSFEPIARNAVAIAEMSGMDVGTIAAVHKLSKAGGSLLTSSKGFATAAAALCSFALVGAFMARANVKRIHVSILNPLCLMGLLIGAMLPFVLGTMVLSAITRVAHKMKEEIQEQF